jgi:hypothetical protein
VAVKYFVLWLYHCLGFPSLTHLYFKPQNFMEHESQEPFIARCQWLTPVILVTQEAEIRIAV